MKSIKKMLLGIALIIFGFTCLYVSVHAAWLPIQNIGLVLPVAGIYLSIKGYTEQEK